MDAYFAPAYIPGSVCNDFWLHAQGATEGTGENVIWVDIAEVPDSRVYSPEAWPPGVGWYIDYPLHVEVAMDPGDHPFTVRAGHVENGTEVVDSTLEVVLHVGAVPAGEVFGRIANAYSTPGEVDGKACTSFTISAEGTTYDAAGSTRTIWVDIYEVDGTRSESPEPWGPGQDWTYSADLHITSDVLEDIVLTVRVGHVDGAGNYVVDDLWKVVIRVLVEHTLTIVAAAGGTTDPPEGTYTYAYGESVTVKAIPDAGYRFVKWTYDAYESEANPIMLTMTQDYTLTPTFEKVLPPILPMLLVFGGLIGVMGLVYVVTKKRVPV